jgi:hypothetical protein
MLSLYKNDYNIYNNKELNDFTISVLKIGENYLKFLISRNKIYLPEHLNPKDAAVDLLAELFILEGTVLYKFRNFFQNNFFNIIIETEEELEIYIRGFIYSVIQNNLTKLYKENDSFTYSIIRNIKEAVTSLNLYTSQHFSDIYIHLTDKIVFQKDIPDKEMILSIVYRNNISNLVINIKQFIQTFFKILATHVTFDPAVRFSDLVSAVKSILVAEYVSRDGASDKNQQISEKLNIKFILDEARCNFSEIFVNYTIKKKLSQNFSECMYSIIDEIISDFSEGNLRQSVLVLMKTHFKSSDTKLFYKIQYCVELFEGEVVELIKKEKSAIG